MNKSEQQRRDEFRKAVIMGCHLSKSYDEAIAIEYRGSGHCLYKKGQNNHGIIGWVCSKCKKTCMCGFNK